MTSTTTHHEGTSTMSTTTSLDTHDSAAITSATKWAVRISTYNATTHAWDVKVLASAGINLRNTLRLLQGAQVRHPRSHVSARIVSAPEVPGSSRPADFPGTDEEVQANRNSHRIDWEFLRCMDCDCRPGGYASAWPCGMESPRVGF